MNKQLRRLGAGLLACYVALFVMVNYVQVVRATSLNDDPLNSRAIVRDFDRPRGQLITADGAILAHTVPAAPGGQFEFQRVYPPETAELFAHTIGFFNFGFGAEGAERAFNDDLAGQSRELEYQSFSDLFIDRERVGDVTLTVRADVQQVAREQLGERRGSVVAIDPRDGAVLAMWSFPSYEPSVLSVHDQRAANDARAALLGENQRTSALVPAAYRRSFFPGSTFKVVTASVGVDTGSVTPDAPVYPDATGFDIDFTSDDLSNFAGSTCGGALFEILARSCNSAFAEMGADTIGEAAMAQGAGRFGFNQRPPFDLPAPAASTFPTEFPDDQGNGPIARASIGQGDTSATPLQMAMVAAAVANGGVIMAPHVLDRVTDETGEVVRELDPEPWQTAMGPGAAATMREAMVGVVEGGTASAARIAGVTVGGKTGTAQLGTDPPSSHAWFICWAQPDGEDRPTVAVAVLVEAQPGVSEVTGGRVAAPIARAVVEAVLAAQG